MRRRLFWTIAGVAAVTGLLVLVGSAIAGQRAAVDATYREMKQSADEAVAVIQEGLDRAAARPAAALELFRLLEGEQLGPMLSRIRRTAGGSEMAFALVPEDGEVRASNDFFSRVDLDEEALLAGETQFTKASTGELVVVAPAEIGILDVRASLLVGIAREAPVVRLADQFRGMLLIVLGIGVLAAVLARVLSSQMAKRLEPLAAASRTLAEGDMSVRVPDLGDPDLDGVADAFNEMAEELESSQVREREFILGVGHDLRTPLTTIGGYAEALESGDVSADEIERIGSVLSRQSQQLGRLIEDLSTLARLEQPEFSLRTEEVDAGAHVREIVDGFERRASEVGVALTVETEDDVTVETDPDRLGQIAQNLVENALRFTPETGSVTVRVLRSEDGAVLEVSDTGVGIAAEDLPKVFDRHYVGKQRAIRNEGSGLGLSIVEGLAGRLGGSVSASSALGKGTTITVTLPS